MIAETGVGMPLAGASVQETANPWQWLSEAFGVYRRQWKASLVYGAVFVAIGYGIALMLAGAGLIAAMPVAVGAFALAGPLMAAGLYAIARADEEGRTASLGEVFMPRAASGEQIAYLGVIILVAMFFWTIVAIGLFVIFLGGEVSTWSEYVSFALSTPRGVSMLSLGTVLGGLIASMIFAVTAFSIPMLMDRECDFATAIGLSLQAVLSRPKEMFLWAWIIVVSVAIGAATMLIGFVLLFPLLGFATWRGYRSVFPGPSS
ncbi:MAG: DUF2189 domain-containing protein [Pseudomonadota bacterium]